MPPAPLTVAHGCSSETLIGEYPKRDNTPMRRNMHKNTCLNSSNIRTRNATGAAHSGARVFQQKLIGGYPKRDNTQNRTTHAQNTCLNSSNIRTRKATGAAHGGARVFQQTLIGEYQKKRDNPPNRTKKAQKHVLKFVIDTHA